MKSRLEFVNDCNLQVKTTRCFIAFKSYLFLLLKQTKTRSLAILKRGGHFKHEIHTFDGGFEAEKWNKSQNSCRLSTLFNFSAKQLKIDCIATREKLNATNLNLVLFNPFKANLWHCRRRILRVCFQGNDLHRFKSILEKMKLTISWLAIILSCFYGKEFNYTNEKYTHVAKRFTLQGHSIKYKKLSFHMKSSLPICCLIIIASPFKECCRSNDTRETPWWWWRRLLCNECDK